MKEDIKETLISFQTTKLAKEIGIKYNDSYSDSFNSILPYLEDGSRRIDFNYDGEYYAACTQSLLQKYLREEYNIFITLSPIFKDGEIDCHYANIYMKNIHMRNLEDLYGKTYEQALEAGLQHALNLIK